MKYLLSILIFYPFCTFAETFVCETKLLTQQDISNQSLINIWDYETQSWLMINSDDFKNPEIIDTTVSKRQYIIDEKNLSLITIWSTDSGEDTKYELPLKLVKERDYIISYEVLSEGNKPRDEDNLMRIYLEKENTVRFRKISWNTFEENGVNLFFSFVETGVCK